MLYTLQLSSASSVASVSSSKFFRQPAPPAVPVSSKENLKRFSLYYTVYSHPRRLAKTIHALASDTRPWASIQFLFRYCFPICPARRTTAESRKTVQLSLIHSRLYLKLFFLPSRFILFFRHTPSRKDCSANQSHVSEKKSAASLGLTMIRRFSATFASPQ